MEAKYDSHALHTCKHITLFHSTTGGWVILIIIMLLFDLHEGEAKKRTWWLALPRSHRRHSRHLPAKIRKILRLMRQCHTFWILCFWCWCSAILLPSYPPIRTPWWLPGPSPVSACRLGPPSGNGTRKWNGLYKPHFYSVNICRQS